MPVDRREIGAAIGSGNFGSRGTPLGYRAEKVNTPNIGRLLNSLGIAAKSFAQEEQRENVELAQMAIREANMNTNTRKPGETAEQHRQRQLAAINEVRARFEDQGMFVEAFTNENPAVQAIDELNGKQKALMMRDQLNTIRVNTMHLPIEEREAAMMKVLKDETALLGGISDKTKGAFLKTISDYAIHMDDVMRAESSEMVKQEGLLKTLTANVAGTTQMVSKAIDVGSPDFETEAEFNVIQQRLKDNPEVVIKSVVQGTRDTYQKALVISNGNRQEASKIALDHLIQVARKFNSPEILNVAQAELTKGQGNSLNQFHQETVDQAKRQLAADRVRTRNNLQAVEADALTRSNQKQYLDSQTEMIQILDSIEDIGNAGTPEHKEQYNRLLEMEKALDEGFRKGDYQGNDQQYINMKRLVNTYTRAAKETRGVPESEQLIRDQIASRGLTEPLFLEHVDKLSKETKRMAMDYLEPILAKDDLANRRIAQLELENADTASLIPGSEVFTQWRTLLENPQTKDTIETLVADGTLSPDKINKNNFMRKYNRLKNNIMIESYRENRTYPTEEEFNNHPQVKKFIQDEHTKMKEIQDMVSKRRADIVDTPENASSTPEATQEVLKKLREGSSFRRTVLSEADMDAVLEAVQNKQATLTDLVTATSIETQGIQEAGGSISDVLSNLDKRLNIRLSDPKHKQILLDQLPKIYRNGHKNQAILSMVREIITDNHYFTQEKFRQYVDRENKRQIELRKKHALFTTAEDEKPVIEIGDDAKIFGILQKMLKRKKQ